MEDHLITVEIVCRNQLFARYNIDIDDEMLYNWFPQKLFILDY